MLKVNWKLQEVKYKGKFIDNWFSNFEETPFILDGKRWGSVENYFQAMKTLNVDKQEEIRKATPSKSKYLGRQVNLRKDWEDIKEVVMLKALRAKWSLPLWKTKLLATGNDVLVEWNNWGDRIWGATLDGIGQNKLGVLLMQIRTEFQFEEYGDTILAKVDLVLSGVQKSVKIDGVSPNNLNTYLKTKGLELDIDTIDTNGWQVDFWIDTECGKYTFSGSWFYGDYVFSFKEE